MNKIIMNAFGFSDYVKKFENQICPICDHMIDISLFKDPLSLKEYNISGLCQDCQDSIFGSLVLNEDYDNIGFVYVHRCQDCQATWTVITKDEICPNCGGVNIIEEEQFNGK